MIKWKTRKIPEAIIFYIQKRNVGDYIVTYIFQKKGGSQIFPKYKDAVTFAKKIMEGGL